MIRTEHLTKTFHPPRGNPIHAVRDATFTVDAGEVFGILGPNGAGKTTLLRMLGTIITPTSGRVVIENAPDASPEDQRRRIGFLSGNTRLYGRLTARETLRYFGRLYEIDDQTLADRIETLSNVLAMETFLDQRVESLSTGQTQKVSIARVMLHDPPILILDEPTAGLDIMTSSAILDFIKDAKDRGRCIIFSTHYMTEAEMLCDRIAFIYAGEIMAVGPKEQLYAQTNTQNLHDAFIHMAEQKQAPAI